MNYVAPGLRELARILDRFVCRVRLVWQGRRLAQLESKLGLLGWQQADYDSATQRHVDKLTDVERAQAQLTNESAALGLTLHQLEERRASERAIYQSQHTARLAARDPLVGPAEESEKALAAKQRECKELEERISALEREKLSDEEKYRVLLAKGDHSDAQQAEVQRLQRRLIAIPREKREWEEKHAAIESELPRLEIEVEQCRAMLSVENEALAALEETFAKSNEALAAEIATRKREKQKIERQIDGLEKTKTQPYREIGRALADHHIEPLNQPHALEVVLQQRERMATGKARLTESLQKSAQEKRWEVWSSWLLHLTFLVLLWGVVWLLTRAR